MKSSTTLFMALFLLTSCVLHPINPSPNKPDQKVTPIINPTPTFSIEPTTIKDAFAFEQNRRLGRGVNLGNALEAPNEGEWGLTIETEFFDLIKEAGFNSVRIPIRFSGHALEKPPYTIDPVFFERVDWVIDNALKRELAVIVDMHHYVEIHEEPRVHKERFISLWEQIANRYKELPDSVYFELLNEPSGTLGVVSWNDFAAEAIKVIRKTNPRRTLIIGPGNWNSIDALPGLFLPEEDRNIIVTFHYYSPFHFTHQGAEWAEGSEAWLGTTWEGSPSEKEIIIQNFNQAVQWANTNRRPLFLGEFGAYYKADMDSRIRWTQFVARTAEANGISWAYWEFGAGFGVYNPNRRAWNFQILKALIP